MSVLTEHAMVAQIKPRLLPDQKNLIEGHFNLHGYQYVEKDDRFTERAVQRSDKDRQGGHEIHPVDG